MKKLFLLFVVGLLGGSLLSHAQFATIVEAVRVTGSYPLAIRPGLCFVPSDVNGPAFNVYLDDFRLMTDVIQLRFGTYTSVEQQSAMEDVQVVQGGIVCKKPFCIWNLLGMDVTALNGRLSQGVYLIQTGVQTIKIYIP